jgi:hypothetical protein
MKGLKISIILVAILLATALTIPMFTRPEQEEFVYNICINNLRQIESAKEQWALEQSRATGDSVNAEEINRYIKNSPLECPEGGIYTYNVIGTDVSCDLEGHTLP